MTGRARKFEKSERHARERRSLALGRAELVTQTTPRQPAASPTSMAVKQEDPVLRAMIDAALAKRRPAVDENG